MAVFRFWPQEYAISTSLPETVTFWNDHEAFIFLSLRTTGRAQNTFQEKVAHSRYGYLSFLLGNYIGFSKEDVVAYHLTADGKLDRFALPDHTQPYGTWSLVDGKIRLTPPPVSAANRAARNSLGFQWDGTRFLPVAAAAEQSIPAVGQKLTADSDEDSDEDEGTDYQFLNKTARQQFKAAGWHYKLLFSYNTDATLPIVLGDNSFDLSVEKSKIQPNSFGFDWLLGGAANVRLSGQKLGSAPALLWSQAGWRTVSKGEYEDLRREYGLQQYRRPLAWTWIVLLIFIVLWRYGSFLHVVFSFLTVKRRVLKNMATCYSFPPATPAQFPALDVAGLDHYTRELERWGSFAYWIFLWFLILRTVLLRSAACLLIRGITAGDALCRHSREAKLHCACAAASRAVCRTGGQ